MNIEDFKKSWKEELDKFKPSVDDEQYQFLSDGLCGGVFTKEEVEKHGKKYSKTYNNGVWKTDFDSMALKTVLKLSSTGLWDLPVNF